MKKVVLGVVPVAIAAAGVSASAEKIGWPEGLSRQLSFTAATQPAAPATADRMTYEQAQWLRAIELQAREIDGVRR